MSGHSHQDHSHQDDRSHEDSRAGLRSRRLSPSEVLCAAAGIDPKPNLRASHDTACGMCGVEIGAGELCNDITKKFDGAFTNRPDLVEGRTLVCQHCAAVWEENVWMNAGGCAYTVGDEVVSLWSKDDIIRFLLDPPKPPFIAYRKFAKQQHVVWRSPVNWDDSRIFVRLGDEVLSIHLPKVRAGLMAWRELQAKLAALGHKGVIAWTEKTLSLATPRMGAVSPDVAAIAQDAGLQHAVATLNGMTAGEWWAVDALRAAEPDAPLPPRRVVARADGWRKLKTSEPLDDEAADEPGALVGAIVGAIVGAAGVDVGAADAEASMDGVRS